MKIYVVQTGRYLDQYINFVTDNKELAEKYRILHGEILGKDVEIDEYDTDYYTMEDLNDESVGYNFVYKVTFAENGDVNDISKIALSGECKPQLIRDNNPHFPSEHLIVYVPGATFESDIEKEKDKILKAARDRRMQFLSERFGL